MRPEKEIKKLRANLLNQLDELELLISRKSETIMKIEAPVVWSQLPREVYSIKDEIKFLKKEINVLEGQIKLIDWVLMQSNEIEFI